METSKIIIEWKEPNENVYDEVKDHSITYHPKLRRFSRNLIWFVVREKNLQLDDATKRMRVGNLSEKYYK